MFEAIRSIWIEIKHKRENTKEKHKNQTLITLKNYKKKDQVASSVTLEITLSLFLINIFSKLNIQINRE